MEVAAEDSVGRGAEGDREEEEPVEDPGPTCRWEIRAGGAGLPHLNGCGRLVPQLEKSDTGGQVSEWELRDRREQEEEREAEAEERGAAGELGAGKELPLFLPAPPFMASAEEEQGMGRAFLLFFLLFFP